MSLVLFADRDGAALGPLGSRTVPALLPLQTVPALERALEALVKAGERSALLVVGPRAAEIEKRFGKGIRWGIALEYVRRGEGESAGDVLRRLEPRLDGDTVAVRGDVGSHTAVGEFLREVEGRKEPIVAAVVGGRPAGLWRIAAGALKKVELPREPEAPDWVLKKDHAVLELTAKLVLLDSIAAYRRADRAEKPAVSPRATVDPKATLGPGATVAEEVIVGAGARLEETSVLPRSVVPSGVSLENAVLAANVVVDAASGVATLLTDRLPPRPARPSSGPGLFDRAAGVLTLILSLPLWPVAFAWALLANAGHATREVVLVGNAPGADAGGRPNRAPFRTFRFETAVPVLRDLPLLLALASGKLALQGVAPLTFQEEAALAEPWEKVRFEAPVGLLSRARLTVPASAPPEVPRLVDAFEARRGVTGLVAPALTALFGAHGWTAPKEFNPDVPPEASS